MPVTMHKAVEDCFAKRCGGEPTDRYLGERASQNHLGVHRVEPVLCGRQLFEQAQSAEVWRCGYDVAAIHVKHSRREVGAVGRTEDKRASLREVAIGQKHADTPEKVGGAIGADGACWVRHAQVLLRNDNCAR